MADMFKVKASELIPAKMVNTVFTPPYGYNGVDNLGLVMGISVRTRNLCSDILIGLNALIGGTYYLLVGLYHDTRQEAYNLMVEEAHKKGANCVIGVHFESTDVGVLCYGTAVLVAKA